MKAELTQGNVLRQMIGLAGPMSFGIFTIIAFNLVDTFFIGQLGKLELAAITFTFPIPMIVASISFGIGIAVSSFVSRALGAEDDKTIKEMTTDALFLALSLVTLISISGFFLIDPIFTMLGAKPEVMPLIREYMEIWFLGTPLIVIPMVGNSVIRALGNAKFPAIVMVVSGVVNAILDPLFIFGYMGFPQLGLRGAAIATLISRFLTLVASLYILHYKYDVFLNPLKRLHLMPANWKKLTEIAIPAMFTNLVGPISTGVITGLVAQYGSVVVAGYGIGARVESFLSILIFGVSSSLGPFVGQNYGAQKYERIHKAIKLANSFPVIWSGICLVIVYFFSDEIASLFSTDPLIKESARNYLLIVTLGILGNGILQNAVAVFNVLGKAKVALLINVFKVFLVYLPFAILLKLQFDESGIYFAALMAHMISGVLIYLYLRKTIGRCHKKEKHVEGYRYSYNVK